MPHQLPMFSPNSHNEGYNVIHSYPFINDGPKLSHGHGTNSPISYSQPNQLEASAGTESHDCYTRQVPPGVFHIKPTWKPVKLDEKPPFSYATIIAHAILCSEHRKLTLSEIYQWISEQYPCYSMKDHRWQNSIRHNLSLQKAFVKLDRDSSTPSGKGCFWTILPGYEQQFIDNLLKRGMGSSTSNVNNASAKQEGSSSHTTSHKQFKKFINSSSSKPTSHLFTIFRMNPTSTSPSPNYIQKRKKKRASRTKSKVIATPPVKYQEDEDNAHDSDCDSGVDLGCGEPFPKEQVSPTNNYYSSLFDTMLMPQAVFTDQLLDTYFDSTMSTPSSIIMDPQQGLFGDVYWPQQPQQTQYDFSPELDCYFDTPSLNYSLSQQQQQQQQQQDYLLYNDFLSSQNL